MVTGSLPPLESTVEEAKTIERLFPESRVLLGADATEQAVKAARAPALLHLATHGFFLPEQPIPEVLLKNRGRNPGAERERIWRRMLAIHAEQQFTIGTVTGNVQPVVVHEGLRNVPVKGLYNWDPGAYFGIYRPDTFYFDEKRVRREADQKGVSQSSDEKGVRRDADQKGVSRRSDETAVRKSGGG